MPIFDPANGGCAPGNLPEPKDSSEWSKQALTSNEWVDGQRRLNTKLHRKAASEMIEHISPGVQGFYSNKSSSFYDRDNEETEFVDLLNKHIAPESFDGGDAWEEDDIDRASAVTIAKELLERGRAKAKGFRTRLVNRVLRKVPFGESIKSVIRGRP